MKGNNGKNFLNVNRHKLIHATLPNVYKIDNQFA